MRKKYIIIGFVLTLVLISGGFYWSQGLGIVQRQHIESVDRMVSETEINNFKENDLSHHDSVSTVNESESNSDAPVAMLDNEQSVENKEIGTVKNQMVATNNTTSADSKARATIVVAGGCFWCMEADIEKLQGVLGVVSGYMGGTNNNPTYKNYAATGHREVVLVTYNPSVVSYREIAIYAIKHMDPTDPDGSFYDRGMQYAPALYYDTSYEKGVDEALVETIDTLGIYNKPLALKILKKTTFWPAEEYHQDYYKKSPIRYKFYRSGSGRNAFIKKYWEDDTGPTLPGETSPYDVSEWEDFVKPTNEVLVTTLTDLQYGVTQKNDTERSFSNKYWNNHQEGIYVDVVSGEPLFSSTDKFDSGTGWPSFTKPIYPDAVTKRADYKLIIPRTEIRSAFADSHLGHIFKDAPKELGGIRYCINSAALRFVPVEKMEKDGYEKFLSLFS